jgi:quercetin dioxygenase-like cupin family protein
MNQTISYKGHVTINGFSDNRTIKQSKKNRNDIIDLENEMLTMEQTLDQFPLTHHFAPGVYAREMFLPAGHTIVGKIHKHAHLNIVSKGSVILSTEEGSKELNAPCVFTSYAGTKRAVYIKEDAIWITIHVTDKTDLKEIEAELIAASFGDLLEKNIGEHS